MLGILWTVLLPFIMLSVYTIVFSRIFVSKWPATEQSSQILFAVMIFAGLTPFNIFAEVISQAPRLVLGSPNLVKRVVFPLEILPVSKTLGVLYQALLNVAILLIGVYFSGSFNGINLLFPLELIPIALITIGIAAALASLGVFLRDLGQLVGPFITLMMFLSPVFFSLDAVSPTLRSYLLWNPLGMMIEHFRSIAVLGVLPDAGSIALDWAIAIVVAIIGQGLFVRIKHAFADVM